MFGTTLEDVMELQKEKFPDLRLPWVVTILADTVLQLSGPQTEGIFRYQLRLWLDLLYMQQYKAIGAKSECCLYNMNSL